MASHSVLKEQLSEMGFEDNQISLALTELGEKATIESAIESIELSQNIDNKTDVIKSDENLININSSDEQKSNNNENSVNVSDDNVIDLEKKRLEYEEKIKQRRKEREEKEKEEALKREVQRRKEGQNLGKMKEELQDLERKRIAEEMKRSKAEEKAARDAVLKQIAADREERKLRNSQPVMPTITTPLMNKQSSSKDGSCRLAIRLLDGTQIIHEFDGRESLSAVRVYVITQKSVEGDITFVMPPNPPFNEEDMQKPLNVLGLCPSARVHVVKR